MYFHVQRLIHDIAQDDPDPAAANALQEGLGGQFGEMRTMMQYLLQAMNFLGSAAKPSRDLVQGIGTEEIGHVELIGTTMSEAGKIFQGLSPFKDGTNRVCDEQAPEGVPSTIAPERLEEFAPGLDPALLELIQATAAREMAGVDALFGPVASESKGSAS